METSEDNLYGMSPTDAKEYVAAYLTTRRLNEKKLIELETALAKWNERAILARGKGMFDLAEAAESEAAKITAERDTLMTETKELGERIDRMRRQIPGLAARERSVEPDILEQELVIAAGGIPGDDDSAAADKASRELEMLEKKSAADEQLAALKARIASEKDEAKR